MNTQVDAIAGGDPTEAPATSPIREVEYVAQAIAGMGAKLAQTAEQDSRLETERRLFVSAIAHDLRTPLFTLRGYLDAIATGLGDPPPARLYIPWAYLTALGGVTCGAIAAAGIGVIRAVRRPAADVIREA
jgi:signal transduction histidine kinase